MKKKLIVICVILFLAVLPLSLKITFAQNDDWAFRQSLDSHMRGDFSANPIKIFKKSAPLFYTQSFLSIPFVRIFGMARLAIFTLLISVFNFYLLATLLHKYLNRAQNESIFLGFLLFFNPLYFYSILGYMTENYFVLFFLITLYYILANKFWQATLFILLGFFLRQFAFIISIAYAIYLFFMGERKYSIFQFLISLTLYIGYKFLILKSITITDDGTTLANLFNFKYAATIIIACLIYLTAYLFPVILAHLKKPNLWYSLGFAILGFGLVKIFLSSVSLYSAEFPFFGNTVGKTGFLIESISGIKPHFYGMYDFYKFWELGSMLLVGVLVLFVVKNYRKLATNFFFIFLAIYIPFQVITIQVYDRYMINVVLIGLLLLVSLLEGKNLSKAILSLTAITVVGFVLLCYQFGMDFVLRERFVSEKGQETYTFSHAYEKELNLVEEHSITFPGSFYVRDSVFVYKKPPQ